MKYPTLSEQSIKEQPLEEANIRPFNEEELEWTYLMLALMPPKAAASAFLMKFPEIVFLETGGVAEKGVVKARIVKRFYDCNRKKDRKAYREIQANREIIKAYMENRSNIPAGFSRLLYFTELMELLESAKTNKERFKYLKELYKQFGEKVNTQR